MSIEQLIAALIDARLFGLGDEEQIAGQLASKGIRIGFASEIEVGHE